MISIAIKSFIGMKMFWEGNMAEVTFSVSWKTVLLNALVVKRFTDQIKFYGYS